MKKSAFTLIEIIIVMILFWLLSGIILQSYVTISKVAFRMEQDKELAKETLILSQVLQNISEEATIDYEKYNKQKIDLQTTKGIVDTLYLTGGQRTGVQIFSTWECELSSILYNENYLKNKKQKKKTDFSNCRLTLKREDSKEEITLLWTGKMMQSKTFFKIIPFAPTLESIKNKNLKTGKPGFWILWTLYSNFYNPKKRSNSSIFPLQLFFSLKWETQSIYDLTTQNNED